MNLHPRRTSRLFSASGNMLCCLLFFCLPLLIGCEWTFTSDGQAESHQIGDLEFTELKSLYPSPMSAILATDGSVWIVTKYDVYRFPDSQAESQELLLDPQIYQRDLGRQIDSPSTAFLTPNGTLWTGSWSGEVLRYQGGKWREIIAQGAGPSGKISALLLNDAADDMWIGAANGLWRFVKRTNSLDLVLESSVEALARRADGSVVVGTYEGVYRFSENRIELVWASSESDGGVTALAAYGEGLQVGTRDGFVELDRANRETERHLAGRWVTAFEGEAGERLVGTWQSGLWLESAGEWHRLGFAHGLPDDSVSTMLLDGEGKLWLGLYGSGTYLADFDLVRATAIELEQPEDLAALLFADPCLAAAELLGDSSSAQIGVEMIAGETHVFFGADRICPKRLGHRRGAGDLVLLTDRGLVRIHDGASEALALPRGVDSSELTTLLVTSSDQLYLGTRSFGLLTVIDRRWQQVGGSGLAQSSIAALLEGADGTVWVASSPVAGEGAAGVAGLHSFDTQHWQAWPAGRESDGPATEDVQSLALLADGRIAIGANGGLSIWDGSSFESFKALIGSEDPFVLDNHFVHSITEDGSGRLYLSHAFWGPGITMKNRQGFEVRSSRDGLFEDRIADIALDADGRAWLLAMDGRVGVYPLEALFDSTE